MKDEISKNDKKRKSNDNEKKKKRKKSSRKTVEIVLEKHENYNQILSEKLEGI